MKRVAVGLVFSAIFLGAAGVALAYALPQSGGVELPQAATGTFNVNWQSFVNNLPVQGFINSLQAAGQNIVNGNVGNSEPSNPSVLSETGQQVLQSIDGWSMAHLGFKLSSVFLAILGVFSWILRLAKSIVDWLINFLK